MMVHTCFSSQQLGRSRWICESKASLIYTLSSKASQGFLKENQKPNKNNVVWEYKLEGLGLPGRLGHGSPKSSCQGSYQLSQCQRKGLPAPSGARGWGGMCVYVWGAGEHLEPKRFKGSDSSPGGQGSAEPQCSTMEPVAGTGSRARSELPVPQVPLPVTCPGKAPSVHTAAEPGQDFPNVRWPRASPRSCPGWFLCRPLAGSAGPGRGHRG